MLSHEVLAIDGKEYVDPNPPSSITVPTGTITASSYSISWSYVSQAYRYQLQEQKNGGSWVQIYYSTGRNITVSGRGLGDYRYRVNAVSRDGVKSAWTYSSVVKVRLPAPSLSLSGQSDPYDNLYLLSWTAVSGAGGYWIAGDINGACVTSACLLKFVPASQRSIWNNALPSQFSGLGNFRYWIVTCDANGNYCGSGGAKRSISVSAIVPPSSITAPTATDYDGAYTVSWPSVSVSATYRLQESKNGGTYVTVHAGAATSKSLTGRGIGDYRYRVRAENANGSSGWRYSGTTPVRAPGTPGSIAVPTTLELDGSYTVSWASSSGATSYTLQQSMNGGAWSTVYSGGSTSKAVSGLGVGDYTYRIRANSALGSSGWRNSSAVQVRVVPATPSITGKSDNYDTSYTLTWNAVSGAGAYYIVGFNNGTCYGGGYCLVQQVLGGATSIASSALPASFSSAGTHELRVASCDASGNYCNGAGAVGVTVTIQAPPVPGSITVPTTTEYDGAFTVSWAASSGAASYTLQQSVNNGSWASIYTGSSTSRPVSGLAIGDYRYRVRSNSSAGSSGWRSSGAVPVRVPAPALTISGQSNQYDDTYSLSWNAVTGAGSYRISGWTNGVCYGGGVCIALNAGTGTLAASTSLPAQFSTPGTHAFTVRACDANGNYCSVSAKRSITIVADPAPTVSLTAPTNGAAFNPGNVTLTATASDAGGNLSAVKFYVNNSYVGQDTTSPFSFTWNAPLGSHSIYAKAVDAKNNQTNSQTVSVTVANPPAAPTFTDVPSDTIWPKAYTVAWSSVAGADDYLLQESVNGGSYTSIAPVPTTSTSKSFAARGDGSYQYRVRASSDFGDSGWRYSNTFTVDSGYVETTINSAPAVAGAPAAGSSTTSDEVGAINGSFAVGPNGDATYSIPFVVAPGTAGVTPQIGLRYSSSAGNGVAGIGTSLTGLSSISRCRQTLSQDDAAEPIRFDAGDRFCLDGQRLMLVEGTYGAPDSEYRTEIDSYRRIYARGGTIGSPDAFEVRAKDGSTSYYGLDQTDARMSVYTSSGSKGPVMKWNISRFHDSVGNHVLYSYDESRHRIALIRYAFGANAAGGARIEFNYSPDRPDPIISYIGGYVWEEPDRLASVTMLNGGQVFRHYQLSYLGYTSGGYSRLDTIQECADTSGSVCLAPTTFAWTGEAASNRGFASPTSSYNAVSGNYVDSQPADLNGDGYLDLLWVGVQSSGEVELTASLYDTASKQFIKSNCADPFTCGAKERFELNKKARKTWRVVDFNGDSSQDVAFVDKSGYLKVLLTLPKGPANDFTWEHLFTPGLEYSYSDRIYVGTSDDVAIAWGDLNSDGLPDLIYRNDNGGVRARIMERNPNPAVCPSGWPAQLPCAYRLGRYDYSFWFDTPHGFYNPRFVIDDQFKVTDFDGDGSVDILAYQAINCSTNYTPPPGELPEPLSEGCSNPYERFYVGFRSATINHATKAVTLEPFGISSRSGSLADAAGDLIPADLNGDGRGDLLYKTPGSSTEWLYQLSDGSGFGPQLVLGSLTENESKSLQFADVNRDGHRDIVITYGTGSGAGNASLRAFHWDQRTNRFLARLTIKSGISAGDNRHHRLFDVDGDGAADWIDIHWGNSEKNVRINPARSPYVALDKVRSINNGLGLDVVVGYAGLNDPASAGFYTRDADAHEAQWNLTPYESAVETERGPTFDIAPPMYLVRSVCTTSPAAGNSGNCAGTGNSGVSRQTYSYTGAKLQGRGRGFLGFRQVRVDDYHSNTYSITEYRQDFPYTGRPRFVWRYHDNGSLLSQAFNNYAVAAENSVPATGQNADRVYNTYTWIANEANFDPDTGAQLGKTQTWNWDGVNDGVDEWGNLVYSRVEHTNGTDGQPFATVETVNDFGSGYNQEKGRLQSSTVTHTRSGEADVVRTSNFTYYGSGTHQGLLATESVSAGGESLATTTHFYDSFGNKARVEQAGTVDSAGTSQTRIQYWEYDEGRYLKREKTRMNGAIVTTREVLARDPVFGLPTRERDIAGVETTSVYGALGRLFFQSQTTGGWSRSRFSTYNGNCPAGTEYVNTTEAAGGGGGIVCYDALGRELMKGAIGFGGGYDRVDTVYNEQGQVVSQSNPYNGVSNGLTTNVYDIYGRLDYVRHADNTTTQYAYSGLTTSVTNANGQVRTETRNARGELVQATDNGGSISYAYDAAGNLTDTTVSAGGVVTTAVYYDALGRKTGMSDPDKGDWSYAYNQFGELIAQTNAKGEQTLIGYDDAGRKVSRTDKSSGGVTLSSTTWTYDSYGGRSEPGALMHVAHSDSYALGATYTEDLAYDGFGRPSWREVSISGLGAVRQHYTYDQYGRPFQVYGASDTYAGKEIAYNSRGFLASVKESAIVNDVQKTWYTVNSVDPRGNQTRVTLHTGPEVTTVTRNYDDLTGRLERIFATDSVNVLQDWAGFSYDNIGNLTGMRDDQRGDTYSYSYDSLNRLTNETVNASSRGVSYQANGNIASKNGQAYSYGARPHAVTSVGGTSYSYDANGNVTSGGGRSISYTVFDKPHTISKGSNIAKFAYGPERGRFKQVSTVDGSSVTKYYALGLEILNKNGGWEYRRDIDGVAQETTYRDGANNVTGSDRYFYLRDHLGSVDVILIEWVDGSLNEVGYETMDMRFGAWGERRNAYTASQVIEYPDSNLGYLTSVTDRGFTGHEMLDAFGLIHMNGRVYDPKLGRFLSADPFVQFPTDTQSYNRYSYVLNNPLGYSDPSGYFLKKLLNNKWFRIGAAVVASALTYGWASGFFDAAFAASGAFTTTGATGLGLGGATTATVVSGTAVGAFAGATSGFVGGAILTGSLKGAVQGAFSGAVFGGIGGHFGNTWNPQRVAANTVAGGITSKASGGSFRRGAIFSLTTSMARVAWEYTRQVTNTLKQAACAPLGNCVYNEHNELDTAGVRGTGGKSGVQSWLGRIFGMTDEGGEHIYDRIPVIGKPIARFINWVSKPHDFMNSWRYDYQTGFFRPFQSQLAAEAFEIYSFLGMPVAGAFTAFAFSAGIPVDAFREINDS